MIIFICVGLAFLVGLAVVVGFMDAAQASAWRRIAAERRQIWEERQRETYSLEHGVDGHVVGGSSTRDQHPEAHRDAPAAGGCDEIFIDKASGKLARRTAWLAAVSAVLIALAMW
jgi:hypothetical protein